MEETAQPACRGRNGQGPVGMAVQPWNSSGTSGGSRALFDGIAGVKGICAGEHDGKPLAKSNSIGNLRAMMKHQYEVTRREEAPRQSHRSFLFPEWVYTLRRLEDGRLFHVNLRKSLKWEPGEVVELEDLLVLAPRF